MNVLARLALLLVVYILVLINMSLEVRSRNYQLLSFAIQLLCSHSALKMMFLHKIDMKSNCTILIQIASSALRKICVEYSQQRGNFSLKVHHLYAHHGSSTTQDSRPKQC